MPGRQLHAPTDGTVQRAASVFKAGFGVQGSGFRVQGSGFRVQETGLGFRVQGSGFRVMVWVSLRVQLAAALPLNLRVRQPGACRACGFTGFLGFIGGLGFRV